MFKFKFKFFIFIFLSSFACIIGLQAQTLTTVSFGGNEEILITPNTYTSQNAFRQTLKIAQAEKYLYGKIWMPPIQQIEISLLSYTMPI